MSTAFSLRAAIHFWLFRFFNHIANSHLFFLSYQDQGGEGGDYFAKDTAA